MAGVLPATLRAVASQRSNPLPAALTRRRVCRCSVSVVAHYRELFRPDKRKFKIIFRPRNIQPNQPKTASFSSVSKP
ncbi:hypothetical protein D1505_02320 [Escherichia coli]|nr:hypothetical protein D1505_02320 [Escherichia coli]